METATDRQRQTRGAPVRLVGRLGRIAVALPGVAMCVTLVALAVYCRELLRSAADGERVVIGEAGFWLVVGGFLATCTGVAVLQARRLGRLVAGPELRLQRSLKRMREGDLDFRVRLRAGDLLTGLADECNQLLDAMQAQRERVPPVDPTSGAGRST